MSISSKSHPFFFTFALCLSSPAVALAQGTVSNSDTIRQEHTLDDVTITGKGGGNRSRVRIDNVELIGQQQLVRAACCNLGESFVTNPSVDVNYSDAATGAQQIKLLGLSGTYVQMLTENVPTLRGAALPYALSFVPGPWMQSIQVSKGASSVKNGYESITGQINIEYLKPQGTDGVRANVYIDSDLMYEANLDASWHLTDRLSLSVLTHFDDFQQAHDENGDGFVDMPKQRQWNVMPRLAYVSPHWISQLSFRALSDERHSGQIGHHQSLASRPYQVDVWTDRYEAQWKNGFPFGDDRNTSIAIMLHGSWHDANQWFGTRHYTDLQQNLYGQLMFESDITPQHNISIGASANYDNYDNELSEVGEKLSRLKFPEQCKETVVGAYAQYTYKLGDRLSAMAGVRYDYSDYHVKGFITPRVHLKYSPTDAVTLRASAGKGYRTVHPLAENTPMLATGRTVFIDLADGEQFDQEEAWNYGVSSSFQIPVAGKTLELNAEYYYTDFVHQLVIDHVVTLPANGAKPVSALRFSNLDGRSFSHTFQVDASYPFFSGFTALAAFRYNDARTTYNGDLHIRPLTSQYKGLLTLSYTTPLELWQFDVTGQFNGPGELYDRTEYPAYFQLQAQISREFRYGSIYIGAENLTDYSIPDPIRSANNPWSSGFDATQVWGPTDGVMFYAGVRVKIEKM